MTETATKPTTSNGAGQRPRFARPGSGASRSGAPRAAGSGDRGGSRGRGGPRRKGPGRDGERPAPEFAQKIIQIRRVARVVAGGRRFNFSVTIVLGDKKGAVGVGVGKGADTALAIDKAIRAAKKAMIKVKLTPSHSIPHQVESKYNSAVVQIIPVAGRGLVAGSSVRTVLTLAGITDVTAKILSGSKNQLNNARAAIGALLRLS